MLKTEKSECRESNILAFFQVLPTPNPTQVDPVLGHRVGSALVDTGKELSHLVVPMHAPTSSVWRSVALHPCQHFALPTLSILWLCVVISPCGFQCIALMTNEAKHLFMCLSTFGIPI